VDANFNNLNSTKVEVFGSQTAKYVYAAPNAIDGTPSFRLLVASDVPTLNQNTTGTASNVTGIVAVANGGTGSSTAPNARTALGLGTIATQDANAVAITGGTINGATVGATTVAAGSFSTLNSSGATRLGGLSGNQSLQVNNVASAVNYAQIVGAVTGGTPTLSTQGTDANIDLTYNAKGTGNHYFQVGGATNFRIAGGASIVNYPMVYGSASGFSPAFLVQGSDTNINLQFSSKGTGQCVFYTGSNLQAVFSNTASTVNWLNFTGAATGAAPTISAQGSDANIGLVLNSKGTGVVALGGSTVANSGLQVIPVTSSANYLTISGSASGVFATTIGSNGTDGSVNINYATKTSGTHVFGTNSGALAQATISHTASAVNRLNLTGAGTNAAPALSAQGSDSDIGLNLVAKSGGSIALYNGYGISARFYGGTNNFAIAGVGSGSSPEISAQGSDANLNIKLTPKGTGTLQFGTYTAGALSPTGYITITDAAGTSRRLLVG
jgi:hypothetical protein